MMKKYRFFYHFYRKYNCMSVHYRGTCYRTPNVVCRAEAETKWNKTQPRLVIQGFSSGIEVEDNMITINE